MWTRALAGGRCLFGRGNPRELAERVGEVDEVVVAELVQPAFVLLLTAEILLRDQPLCFGAQPREAAASVSRIREALDEALPHEGIHQQAGGGPANAESGADLGNRDCALLKEEA